MEPPRIQYVRTPDGFDIAFTVCGEGEPFVMMPWPHSHRGLWWQTVFARPLSDALAARYRLVQYDSRGQGMSTRGLPEDTVIEDYLTDLETVVDYAGIDRFVLYGGPLFSHVAIHYASKHPRRVKALILGDTSIGRWGPPGLGDIARSDWEVFLHIIASGWSLEGAPLEVPYWRESITQEDYLRMNAAGRESRILPLLAKLEVPTLIVNARILRDGEPESVLAEDGRTLAATIPNAHLVLYDGFARVLYSNGPEPPRFVEHVEAFLRDINRRDAEPPAALPARLSLREVEVLRLVADGKTNREIAETLVISERTVINHLSHIFTKTGAENRAGAAAYALRHGLV